MKKGTLIAVALVMIAALGGCMSDTLSLGNISQLLEHENAVSVAEAVSMIGDGATIGVEVTETNVEIYGYVSALGELFCPCFELHFDDESVTVKYALFPEEEEYADVSVDGISNGDRILVVGTLRTLGQLPREIWAIEIHPMPFLP